MVADWLVPIDDGSMWPMRQDPASAALGYSYKGGHPPFELTTDEAKQLPRTITLATWAHGEPRNASRPSRGAPDAFLRRIGNASCDVHGVFAGQDRRLRVDRRLSDSNRYDDTLLIVTADVAQGDPPCSWTPNRGARAARAAPVRPLPDRTKAPSRSEAPTDFTDVATTIADALGLKLGPDAPARTCCIELKGSSHPGHGYVFPNS